MRRLTIVRSLLVIIALLVASNRVQAQGFPGGGGVDFNDPDMQEMMQMGMQMFQRMQESGIDLQSIGEQVQAGTFDREGFQQMLIDKGIIDNDMMNKMQKTGIRMVSKMLKQQLASTDDEWALIGPRIDKVIELTTVAQRPGSMQMGMGNVRNISTVQKALEALKTEMKETGTTDSKIKIKIEEYRAAFAKASAELKTAREDLRGMLTVRQEAVLLNFGLLD